MSFFRSRTPAARRRFARTPRLPPQWVVCGKARNGMEFVTTPRAESMEGARQWVLRMYPGCSITSVGIGF